MRKYTEPVADFDDVIAADEWRGSYLPPLHANQMLVNHWVECEGFKSLRILAVGNGLFLVRAFLFGQDAPIPGVLPTRFMTQDTIAVPVGGFAGASTRAVADTFDITGAKCVGIELRNYPENGHATEINLHAFLR